MKRWKTYAGLLLALVLCLSLAACGGGNSDNDDDIIDGVEDTAPDTIENLVIDTSVEFDYSAYMGTWLGEDDSVLVMEHVDGITNSERFRLNGADQALLASGNIQYVEEYGYVYLYNEHNAIAHISWFYEDDTLYIDSFGTFTKVSGDALGETAGDDAVDAPQTISDLTTLGDPVEYDYSAFLGTWIGQDAFTIVVEEDSGEGAPYVMYNHYGEPYTNGVFRYVEEYDGVYFVDDAFNVATMCWFSEDGKLEIPGFSTYSKQTGDGFNYIPLSGSWYLDGDIYGSKCIEFDASSTMWTYYERGENGYWENVDDGTVRETGVNQYEAVSFWDESKTYDFYLENDMLYWPSEDGSYEEFY